MLVGQVIPEGLAAMPPGPELACVLAEIDLAHVPNDDIVEVLQARSRQLAHDQAHMFSALSEVIHRLPFAGPLEVRRADRPELYGPDEVRAALAWTRRAAESETDLAHTLVDVLPLIHAALLAGHIDRGKAWVFAHHLGDLPADQITAICTALLLHAPRLTAGQIAERIKRLILELDPAYYERRYRKAIRDRAVVAYLSPDGTAVISASGLPADEAAAAWERLDTLARAARRDGHPATLDQIRADLVLGLLDGSLHGLSREEILQALLERFAGHAAADTAQPASPARAGSDDHGGRHGGSDQSRTEQDSARLARTDQNAGQSSAHQDSAHQDSAHQDSAHQDSAHQDSAHQDSAHQDSAGSNSSSHGQDGQDIDGSGNDGSGNDGSGNDGSGNDGSGNDGSGNDGSGNDGSGNDGSGNDGSGNDGSGNDGSGNDGSGNDGSGNDGSGNDGSGNDGSDSTTRQNPRGRSEPPPAESATATAGRRSTLAPARTGDQRPESPDSGTAPPDEDQRVGTEVRVPLSTLLGLDHRAGELPGWGPIPAQAARRIVARQRRAQWRWVIVDDAGRLLAEGITRHRPTTLARNGPRGGVVEIQIPISLLITLATAPDDHGSWAGVITDIATRFDARCERGSTPTDLDAHPDDRFPRAALRRHIQVRDRCCVHPGCRSSALRADQDHTLDHTRGGTTTQDDLAPLCRHDHMLKTEGGWVLHQPEPGRFVWHSPLGRTYPVEPEPILPPSEPVTGEPEPRSGDPAPDTDHVPDPNLHDRAPPAPADGPAPVTDAENSHDDTPPF